MELVLHLDADTAVGAGKVGDTACEVRVLVASLIQSGPTMLCAAFDAFLLFIIANPTPILDLRQWLAVSLRLTESTFSKLADTIPVWTFGEARIWRFHSE